MRPVPDAVQSPRFFCPVEMAPCKPTAYQVRVYAWSFARSVRFINFSTRLSVAFPEWLRPLGMSPIDFFRGTPALSDSRVQRRADSDPRQKLPYSGDRTCSNGVTPPVGLCSHRRLVRLSYTRYALSRIPSLSVYFSLFVSRKAP